MIVFTKEWIRAVLFWVMACGVAIAQDASDLPPMQHHNGIAYVTGGIGADEAAAFKAARGRHALSLEFFAQQDGKAVWDADVDVHLIDGSGVEVLAARADGPFFQVDLPPGHYHFVAIGQGRTLTRDLDLVAGHPQQLMLNLGGREPTRSTPKAPPQNP